MGRSFAGPTRTCAYARIHARNARMGTRGERAHSPCARGRARLCVRGRERVRPGTSAPRNPDPSTSTSERAKSRPRRLHCRVDCMGAPNTGGPVRRRRRPDSARAYDAMIAAIAIANDLPLYTCNPGDFAGIDGLEIVAVAHPDQGSITR